MQNNEAIFIIDGSATPLPGECRRYLTSSAVRQRYGNISNMSLWRWLADPELGFPQPIRVGKLRLFDLEKLEHFDATHGEAN